MKMKMTTFRKEELLEEDCYTLLTHIEEVSNYQPDKFPQITLSPEDFEPVINPVDLDPDDNYAVSAHRVTRWANAIRKLMSEGAFDILRFLPPPTIIRIKRERFYELLDQCRANGEKLALRRTPKPKIPLLIPASSSWGDVVIRFIDGHDVEIKVKTVTHNSNYREMGFEDQRTRRPDQQWELLRFLADNHGEISWDTSGADSRYKKRKQQLSKGLRSYFGIIEDPFFTYREDRSYKIKLNLLPESLSG